MKSEKLTGRRKTELISKEKQRNEKKEEKKEGMEGTREERTGK
jgi:hypothetical protein